MEGPLLRDTFAFLTTPAVNRHTQSSKHPSPATLHELLGPNRIQRPGHMAQPPALHPRPGDDLAALVCPWRKVLRVEDLIQGLLRHLPKLVEALLNRVQEPVIRLHCMLGEL